jgi:RNA dependent RNA polymerase
MCHLEPISLNRQLITLLEFMGIESSVFVEFQNAHRKILSMALLCKKSAVSFLRKAVRFYNWEAIYDSGVLITQEPFIRSLLMTLCRDR